MNLKVKTICYWVTTALITFSMLSGGVMYLIRQPETMAGMKQLGYPVYFITILGFWKVLGGIALLVPRFPRLKEWAYAGIFFDLTGAAASHAASGDPGWHVVATLGFAVLTLISWALRPQSRMLGVLIPAKEA